jgi:hypothetical protein
VAGFITILSPPTFSIFVYEHMSWSLIYLNKAAPLEIVASLVCMILFLSGKWKVWSWVTFFLLAAHYTFWYFAGQSNPEASGYIGPPGPIVGFCSAVTWFLYASGVKREPREIG